ncbi:MAG: sialate O-acetylesterase [Spirochaetaceae bacterium]|jgi:sialate O-acetylesterase|nr:sialate O-acetylesterase [Spirochaetaceae bacterium]
MIEKRLRAEPIFSSRMILQREKPVSIWGTGTEGTKVHLLWESGNREIALTCVIKNEQWRFTLPPLPAGLRAAITVRDETESLRFDDVLTGDVWFAGGQSNMELELRNCLNGESELARCGNPEIRFYQPVKRAFVDETFAREEKQCCWRVCDPETAGALSAAAYFFAWHIHRETHIPIGIINCSWGGTSISAWMSEKQLARSGAGQRYLDDYTALMGDKTDAQYDAEMETYFSAWRAWDERVRLWREKEPDASWETLNKECGLCPWPQPAGKKSPYRPGNLYHAMIKRVAPYTIKGFLYYQGEEDDPRAADYYEMMYYLIDQWRVDWKDDTLPFLFVQLPMYASREEVEAGQPVKNWCVLRENQYRASVGIANTGMAVIIDRGEFDNIHPLDKQTVGFRLALQALKKVYGKNIEDSGPVFSWARRNGATLALYFDHAESGLVSLGDLTGFEIAGDDGVYYPAKARIDGASVVLQSDRVSDPDRVRYAWIKFGPTPLYAGNGLPAMPFRSMREEE